MIEKLWHNDSFLGLLGVFMIGCVLVLLHKPVGASDDQYQISAKFSSIEGLRFDAPVLMSGVQIGSVHNMSLNPDNFQVSVQMRIDDNIVIPTDSSAAVVSDGIFGGKYLRLVPGGAFDNLKASDQINYVQNGINFQAILERIILSAEDRSAKESEDTEAVEQEEDSISGVFK